MFKNLTNRWLVTLCLLVAFSGIGGLQNSTVSAENHAKSITLFAPAPTQSETVPVIG
jgi:hypothetical protein